MKVIYDKTLDILQIQFSNEPIVESDEEKKGLIIDYNKDGGIVAIEMLNASKKVLQPNKVEYEIA
ncbi:MAG: DUF2283 domain-containing protein [Bacteroidetes bacterium]|nr:DUF2283 domain-containing protein [Bacteroidota bacterium]MBK7504652.1 DUF2283 domain-containing protein [Bacteroidota bacterium]MBK9633443.1 DUF2283 domain-containing protein [Bacteroidota bacterium]MBL0079915.1 DUF2283 domain-containing protein [Bacteroidota bacterium]